MIVGKKGGGIFKGGLKVLHKKSKSEIFDTKKNNEQFSDLRRGMLKKWGWCF